MPLLESDWSLFWLSKVMVTDACDDAYGVIAAEFAPALVSSWGRLQGRHRFRLQSPVQWAQARARRFGPSKRA